MATKKTIGRIKAAAATLAGIAIGASASLVVNPDDTKVLQENVNGENIEQPVLEGQYEIIKNFYLNKVKNREVLTSDEWQTLSDIRNYEMQKRGGYISTKSLKDKQEIYDDITNFIQ